MIMMVLSVVFVLAGCNSEEAKQEEKWEDNSPTFTHK